MAEPAPARVRSPFAPHHTGPLTALQVIETILDAVGAPNRARTIDHVSAGDPLNAVTGIAVTAIATLDCLKRAAASGHNLIVTYDPAWWSSRDGLDGLEGNPLFIQKRDFIRDHRMVVFNLHDHWRDRVPDGLTEGMAGALGWPMPAEGPVFDIAPATLATLARQIAHTLGAATMRVVGDPNLAVSKVAMALGNAEQMPTIALLNGPADVVLVGYCREWEIVEYVQDMVASGSKKGLILLGEDVSVEPGMRLCAEWLKSIVEGIPVVHLAAGEGYWAPAV